MAFKSFKYLPMFLMLHLSLITCAPSPDKFALVKKDMIRDQVIEIIGMSAKSETSIDIESLSDKIDTLNRSDFYLFLIDDDTKKVLETASYSEPAPEKFLEKWA